ncbi:MAG: Imidazole glycerol phosphate synthase amidotransferase subunit [Myxococcaceae bacterium]|nr:Imidazole glycerol phosphate synthase amidotransferase subunit [Myxococcaceae bacterium]
MRATPSRSVVIADLGLGNLHSVARAIERAGGEATITADPDALRRAPKVIVPGQGAFRDCGVALERGFGSALREIIALGTPYLGLCLGMQLLFEKSAEAPGTLGLGLFAGTVERFPRHLQDQDGTRLKVPHMGWNEVDGTHPALPKRGWFYFVHSYICVPEDESLIVGGAHYGIDFCAAVARDNVFACQCHPEKSQEEGHLLLKRFVEGEF